ncbi:hypothetical protein A4A49_58195, partial [Nicotiana attenuata]
SAIDSSTVNPVERPKRTTKPPIWLKDYVVPGKGPHSSANCLYPIADVVAYNGLSAQYQSFVSKFSLETEPQSYAEATKDPRWIDAMKAEIQTLEDNKTWKVVPLPHGKRAIGCR